MTECPRTPSKTAEEDEIDRRRIKCPDEKILGRQEAASVTTAAVAAALTILKTLTSRMEEMSDVSIW